MYHKRKDIFNIVKIEQHKGLYVKLITLYLFFLFPYLLEQEDRTPEVGNDSIKVTQSAVVEGTLKPQVLAVLSKLFSSEH